MNNFETKSNFTEKLLMAYIDLHENIDLKTTSLKSFVP